MIAAFTNQVSGEPGLAQQELGAGEHRFDDVLALAVERGSVAGIQDRVDAFGFGALA